MAFDQTFIFTLSFCILLIITSCIQCFYHLKSYLKSKLAYQKSLFLITAFLPLIGLSLELVSLILLKVYFVSETDTTQIGITFVISATSYVAVSLLTLSIIDRYKRYTGVIGPYLNSFFLLISIISNICPVILLILAIVTAALKNNELGTRNSQAQVSFYAVMTIVNFAMCLLVTRATVRCIAAKQAEILNLQTRERNEALKQLEEQMSNDGRQVVPQQIQMIKSKYQIKHDPYFSFVAYGIVVLVLLIDISMAVQSSFMALGDSTAFFATSMGCCHVMIYLFLLDYCKMKMKLMKKAAEGKITILSEVSAGPEQVPAVEEVQSNCDDLD